MRLWSVHPMYLDTKALTSMWREGLGAITSLDPNCGYHNHPQLDRFKKVGSLNMQRRAVAIALSIVCHNSYERGYSYNPEKINKIINRTYEEASTGRLWAEGLVPVTKGQVEYEMKLLYDKIKSRSVAGVPNFKRNIKADRVKLNPVFYLVDGDIEPWEKVI